VVLGEAKWRDRPVDARVVGDLLAKRGRLPSVADDAAIVIWAAAGADPSVQATGARAIDAATLVAG
jgi:hypothetical protein